MHQSPANDDIGAGPGRGGLVVYKSNSGKTVIIVKSPGVTEADERSPLLLGKNVPTRDQTIGSGERGNGLELGVTFIAILVCSFLSAFDFTVIAAIFPLMYPPILPSPQFPAIFPPIRLLSIDIVLSCGTIN